MIKYNNYRPHGVIPAALMAFKEDLSIDEVETRRHLLYLSKMKA